MDTSIIIPAFNEEASIGKLLDKLIELKFHEKYEILVVNDGSSDNTLGIIKQYPVKVISTNINRGYGAALKTGIRKVSGRNIIIMDSDGQHSPTNIPAIENLLENNELVIGERKGVFSRDLDRKYGKRVIRFVGEYLVGQKLSDFNSGYRGFNADIIKSLLHIMPNGFSFSTTSTLAFIKEGYSVATIPVMTEEREGRKSNVRFFTDGPKTILLLFRIIMLFNPLKVFFPASVFITAAGILFGVYGYASFGRYSNAAVLISIVGIFLFFIGLLADQIAIMNRRAN